MKRLVMTLALVPVAWAVATAAGFAQNPAAPVAAAPAIAAAAAQTVTAAVPLQGGRPTPATPTRAETPQERPAVSTAPASLDDIPNVRVDVTITYQVGQNPAVKRSASLTVANMEQGSLRSGNQVPVPSMTYVGMPTPPKGDGATTPAVAPAGPVTSFNYRSVGLNVDARRVRIAGNRAKLDLSVEFSAIDEKGTEQGGRGTSYPSFPTFSQNLSLVLDNGKPVVIAQTSDVVDNVERKQSVEVRATILR